MSDILFSTFNMSEKQAQELNDIFTKLKSIYPVEVDTSFSLDNKMFGTFTQDNLTGPVFRIDNNNTPFYLNFIRTSYSTTVRNGTAGSVEYEVLGAIDLKNNFEHILIRPETLLDRMYDLINSIDINFETDEEFSKKFFVTANDKFKAQLQLTGKFRSYIKEIDLKEFVIEISDNKLIAGDRKVASWESAHEFCKFMTKLSGASM